MVEAGAAGEPLSVVGELLLESRELRGGFGDGVAYLLKTFLEARTQALCGVERGLGLFPDCGRGGFSGRNVAESRLGHFGLSFKAV